MNTMDEKVFLIADLAGYTALTEAHGDIWAARIVKRYVEIVNDNIFPGTKLVERTGDEILMVSNNVTSIVRTAVNLRDTIENEQHFPILLPMGFADGLEQMSPLRLHNGTICIFLVFTQGYILEVLWRKMDTILGRLLTSHQGLQPTQEEGKFSAQIKSLIWPAISRTLIIGS